MEATIGARGMFARYQSPIPEDRREDFIIDFLKSAGGTAEVLRSPLSLSALARLVRRGWVRHDDEGITLLEKDIPPTLRERQLARRIERSGG